MTGYAPLISERANCGPTVLAGVLRIDTEPAIELISKAIGKPWPGFTNVGHIRKALELKGYSMIKIENLARAELDGDAVYNKPHPVMVFMQITGPWMGKGWRSEYNHTHWALVTNEGILDVNNRDPEMDRPFWLIPSFWANDVMNRLVDSVGGTDWFVRACYEIKPTAIQTILCLQPRPLEAPP